MNPPEFPVFNHVAMSVERALLEPEGRAALLDFYGEVFGWGEMPTMSVDGECLVMRAHSNEQFIFLVADDVPMRCPTTDHFGMSVRTADELYATVERARKFRERDLRVEIDEPKGGLTGRQKKRQKGIKPGSRKKVPRPKRG